MDATHAAKLGELFEAERRSRRLHDELADSDREPLLVALRSALAEASGAAGTVLEPEEASLRLVCVARLLGELDGPRVVDALVDILACEHAEARGEAGEQLQGLAFERFREVAEGVERALERLPVGSPALVELPYILVEVPEGGVLKLLERFLRHEDADAVAAAIEACVEIGDPVVLPAMRELTDDERTTAIVDEEGGDEVTLGDLAAEAIELLGDPVEGDTARGGA